MPTAQRFNRFLNNIHLISGDREDAARKYNGVAGKLHSHYYSTSYSGSTKLLIGSYGKHTSVRPPRDVDVLFLMPYEQYTRYDTYSGNGQSRLLQDVKAVLQERYSTTDKIRGDGQVVVVPFQGGHTVELLPAWTTTNSRYLIPDTHGGGSWKVVDHKAEIANVADSDRRSNGNTRNLIQMMKTWQAACAVPIKSLALELRAVNFLATWGYFDKGTSYYDWMVRDFLAELITKANSYCTIPGIEERCYYGDTWLSKAQSAHQRAIKACDYESSDSDILARVEWCKIFGSLYDS